MDHADCPSNSIPSLFDLVDDSALDEDDIYDLMEALIEVLDKWNLIGIALRLKPSKIRAIDVANRGNLSNCLMDILTDWLDRNYNVAKFGVPSWQKIVKAVASPAAGDSMVLAEAIARKHLCDNKAISLHPRAQLSTPTHSNVILRYGEFLKSYYDINSIACDDKLSIAPCCMFINLALITKAPSSQEDDFSKSTFHGGVDQIVASKTPLAIDDLVTSDSRFVLVEGPPGIGKSTLCLELCRKWDTFKSLKSYKIVLLLKLREKRIQNAVKLDEFFYHEDKELCHNVVKDVLYSEGEGILLILDGFDEIPASIVRDRNNLIMKLISGMCMPKATLVVSSRPSALHHERIFPEHYRHVEILGFTDESKLKFAEVAFSSKPDVLAHFKKFIFSNPIINSLMYLPINSAIIVQVYKNIKRSRKLMPKTMTQLYTTLVLVLIRRHMIDTKEWNEDSELPDCLEDLSDDITAVLKRVSKLAYKGLFEGEVQLEFSSVQIGKNFQHLGLLGVTKEASMTQGATVTYSFLHLSMQEFLAAWHVSGQAHLMCCKSKLYENLGAVPPHLNAFVRILAGMVGLTKLVASVEKVEKLLLHCLFEAQNLGDFSILKNSEQYMELSNHLDAYVFGYTLVNSPICWKIHINSSAFDMLLSSLAHYAPSGSNIMGKISELAPKGDFGSQYSFPKLQNLPNSLLRSVSSLSVNITSSCLSIDGLITGIPAMSNLSNIDMTIQSQTCQDDHKLFSGLKSLQNLKKISFLLKCNTSSQGVLELSDFFVSCNSLEDVTMYFYNNPHHGKYILENNNRSMILSALSCSNVTDFATNIPFVSSSFPSKMRNMRIEIRSLHNWPCTINTIMEISKFLLAIADTCKHSMETLSLIMYLYMELSLPPQRYCNFLSVLNNSLHSNPALSKVSLSFCRFEPLESCTILSQALRRDSSILLHDIRKSTSLCSLATPRLLSKKREEPSVSRSLSCPDLRELQSLRDLHPLLDKELYSHKTMEERMPRLYPYLTQQHGKVYALAMVHHQAF